MQLAAFHEGGEIATFAGALNVENPVVGFVLMHPLRVDKF